MKNYTEEVKQYAAIVHALTCTHNHTDGCGWFYGEPHRNFEYESANKKYPIFKNNGGDINSLILLLELEKPNRLDWLKK